MADMPPQLLRMVGAALIVLPMTAAIVASVVLRSARAIRGANKGKNIVDVAFFHPNANDGGGGERVLWCAIKAVRETYPDGAVRCWIYSGENVEGATIVAKAQSHFNLDLGGGAEEVRFVELSSTGLLDPRRYPRFTLVLQSLGAVVVALECVARFQPAVVIDTTGHAFILPVFKLLCGCRTGAYVHYPTITSEMIGVVRDGATVHNNSASISSSPMRTRAKLIYYRVFAAAYAAAGLLFCDVVMANSSWTAGHLAQLWGGKPTTTEITASPGRVGKKAKPIHVVFPPCNTTNLQSIPLQPRRPTIVSVAQFRPEKDHARQIDAFAMLLDRHPKLRLTVTLVLVGSSRHSDDAARVAALRRRVSDLGLDDSVRFAVNASYTELIGHLSTASVGLHTMWNEHFGISVVELLAAGVVPVAHRSGGPLLDIVDPIDAAMHEGAAAGDGGLGGSAEEEGLRWRGGGRGNSSKVSIETSAASRGERAGTAENGFLATEVEEYAEALWRVLDMTVEERLQVQRRGRQKAKTFSDELFAERFLAATAPLITPNSR